MKKKSYLLPTTLDETFHILREYGTEATILSGGTDLIPRMRERAITPGCWVDIHLLPLNTINYEDQHIIIGARVTHTQAIYDKTLLKSLPIIVSACNEIGSPPIRNRGTIGGNLLNASPAADTAPALLALDAILVLESAKSKRSVPISGFFCGPGKTVRKPDELLTEIHITIPASKTAAKFFKLGQRSAMAIGLVSVAARITLDDDERISNARIALGSVAPVPMRAVKAEALLEGNMLSKDLIHEAALTAGCEASPITDVRASAEYRKQMVEVLTRRNLSSLIDALIAGNKRTPD